VRYQTEVQTGDAPKDGMSLCSWVLSGRWHESAFSRAGVRGDGFPREKVTRQGYVSDAILRLGCRWWMQKGPGLANICAGLSDIYRRIVPPDPKYQMDGSKRLWRRS
jgi:hypothetical protein